jgi:hypothetical protein
MEEMPMITSDPDTWTEADWARHDAARNRMCSARADQFARDLDLLGWKIVPQRSLEPGEPSYGWPMNGTKGATPWWAEPFDPPKPPTLRLLNGDKP